MSNKLPDFLCVPCSIIKNKEMTALDGLVYGTIYWYSRQKLEKCVLSNPVFAELLDVDSRSIQRSLARLEKSGFIKVIYKDDNEKQRLEIIPLVTFQSHPEKQDTTVQSYHNSEGTTPGSYLTNSKSLDTTEESYQYDPTVIQVRQTGHTGTTQRSYPVEADVRPYGHHNNIENIEEERVNKTPQRPRPSKSKVDKEELTASSNDEKIQMLLDRINKVRGTRFIAIKPLRSNFSYWLSIYDLDFMLTAVDNIPLSPYWKDKMTPDIILRRKNPRGEEVDYIGELYNLKVESSINRSKPKLIVTEESIEQEREEQRRVLAQRGTSYVSTY